MAITVDGYPLDLVETEQHDLVAEVTEHPVEDGSDVSDNVRLKPRELTFTNAIVSDTPIGAIAQDESRTGASAKFSQDAYNRLEAIWLARNTVTVVTGLKKYENMILDRLTVPRDSKTSAALVFTAHFKEVRIVKNKRVTVAVPNLTNGTNLGGKGSHTHPANVTYVQTHGVESRAYYVGLYGQPVLTTSNAERLKTNPEGDPFGELDHFGVPEGQMIDGWVADAKPKPPPGKTLPSSITSLKTTKAYYRNSHNARIPGYTPEKTTKKLPKHSGTTWNPVSGGGD